MEKSKLLNLNLRDVGKGILVTFLAALVLAFTGAFTGSGFSIFLDGMALLAILETATSAGLAFLVTSLFENSDGKLGKRERRN